MKTARPRSVADGKANGTASAPGGFRLAPSDPLLQRLQPSGMPHFYGDGDNEMGESTIHTITVGILLYGLSFHFLARKGYRVFGNLNLYYSTEEPGEYVSPDVMVVRPPRPLAAQLSSYRLGSAAPAPLLVAEVLSTRTWQQGDLDRKPRLYSQLGVHEYLLADVTGEMLEARLLLLRRQADGSWHDEQDADGGITSRLGFRVILESDGQLRVREAATGKRYARPEEAQAATDELTAARERIQALEVKLSRLQGASPSEEPQARKGKGRRRKS